MSNVTLSIGGRSFTVATADGEESHILGLGAMIDAKLAAMGDQAALSETRMLLFAALLLADDLIEAQNTGSNSVALDEDTAQRITAIADTLENLAQLLETAPDSA